MNQSRVRQDSRNRTSRRRGQADGTIRGVRDNAVDAAHRVMRSGGAMKEQVMQKAAEVTRALTDGVKAETERYLDEQKDKLGSKVVTARELIQQAAHALHAVKADSVAEVAESTAERFGSAAEYIEGRSVRELISDTEDAARRHAGLAVGGLFLTGLLAARFIKASAERGENSGRRARSPKPAARGRNNGRA